MTRDTYDMFGDPDRGRFGYGPKIKGASYDFDLVLHHETSPNESDSGAILVSSDGMESRAVWLPKVRIDVFRGSLKTPATRKSGQRVVLPVITVTVPESLAKEKGLI